MKIDRKFKEVMALAMMMALASKKVNKGRLLGGGEEGMPQFHHGRSSPLHLAHNLATVETWSITTCGE